MPHPHEKYGNPIELAYWIQAYGGTDAAARWLRRSKRIVRDWLSGRVPVPWYVPELMRLADAAHFAMLADMGARSRPMPASIAHIVPASAANSPVYAQQLRLLLAI